MLLWGDAKGRQSRPLIPGMKHHGGKDTAIFLNDKGNDVKSNEDAGYYPAKWTKPTMNEAALGKHPTCKEELRADARRTRQTDRERRQSQGRHQMLMQWKHSGVWQTPEM